MGKLTGTFGSDRVAWASPMDVDTAAQALGALGLRGHGQYLSKGPLRGRCHPPTVIARRRSVVNNSWRPILRGELIATGGGSRLDAEIRPTTGIRVFSVVWITVATLGAIAATVIAITTGNAAGLPLWLMPVLGLGISIVGGAMSSGDRDFLRTTIGRAINGTDISTQGATP